MLTILNAISTVCLSIVMIFTASVCALLCSLVGKYVWECLRSKS